MSVPSPIPTKWRGVLYRSRTEARWAVFFDALGVNVVYEPETYNLDGAWYLPDFAIEAWNAFLEVKSSSGPTPFEQERCRRLADLTRKTVFLASGVPGENLIEVYFPRETPTAPLETGAIQGSGKGRFTQCRRCGGLSFEWQDWDGLARSAILFGAHKDWDRCGEKLGGLDQQPAIDAARNERFGVYPDEAA